MILNPAFSFNNKFSTQCHSEIRLHVSHFRAVVDLLNFFLLSKLIIEIGPGYRKVNRS